MYFSHLWLTNLKLSLCLLCKKLFANKQLKKVIIINKYKQQPKNIYIIKQNKVKYTRSFVATKPFILLLLVLKSSF